MRIEKLLFTSAAAVVLLSCGVIGGKKSTSPPRGSQSSFSKEHQASFLYTEGLKSNLMNRPAKWGMEIFQEVISLNPTHAPAYYELATLNAMTYNTDEAIRLSRKANQLDSTNVWYQAQLGQLFIQNDQYDSAIRVYHSLLALDPNQPEVYMRLAILYNELEQPYMAISLLDSIEYRFGVQEVLSNYKRQLLIESKLYDKALTEAKAIVSALPYDESNWVALAEIYAVMGKDSLALESYQEALTLNPLSQGTLISMNNYYLNKNDHENFFATAKQLFELDDLPVESKIQFFEGIRGNIEFYRNYYLQFNDLAMSLAAKYPDDFRVTELYAQHLLATGDIEGAANLYKGFITGPDVREEAFKNVLDIEGYLNRPDSVAKYCTLALEHFPDDYTFYIRKGAVLSYFMKDYAGAEEEFKKALQFVSEDSLRSVIYGLLGDTGQQTGNIKQSIAYYKKSIKSDPTNAVAYNNYSYMLSELGQDLKQAETLSKIANQLSPNNPTYLDTQAWVYYKQGKYEEAKKVMKQAIALDQRGGESEVLYLHYGDILYALGDHFMASVYWKKALEAGANAEEIEQRLKQVEK